MSSTFEFNI